MERVGIPWDENSVQALLGDHLAQINDEVGRNPDVYVLVRSGVAWGIVCVLEKLANPTQETLVELDRLSKWPFAEAEGVRSAARQAFRRMRGPV
jgi:hypothetical protein